MSVEWGWVKQRQLPLPVGVVNGHPLTILDPKKCIHGHPKSVVLEPPKTILRDSSSPRGGTHANAALGALLHDRISDADADRGGGVARGDVAALGPRARALGRRDGTRFDST